MPYRRKNLFDEWNEQLDVRGPITTVMLSFWEQMFSFILRKLTH